MHKFLHPDLQDIINKYLWSGIVNLIKNSDRLLISFMGKLKALAYLSNLWGKLVFIYFFFIKNYIALV